MPVLETLSRDARYAARVLRRSPAFTAAVVLTIALAIAVNTAVFSVVDAVLLKPLPYPDPGRLALVAATLHTPGGVRDDVAQNGRTWEAIRDRASGFDRAAFSTWTTGVNMVAGAGGTRTARHVRQQRVGAGFFSVLGIRPAIGREFTAEEDRAGGAAAAVLSAALWRQAFDADPAIVGGTITLRGQPFTVVGIMPDGFQSGERADVWTPLGASREGEGEGENYAILVRLRGGDSLPRAAAELARIGDELSRQRPAGAPEMSLSLQPLQAGLTRDLRRPLLLLWAAVAVVWLVACVNLAGLLLARAAGRAREMATRMALGSGRGAVVRQLAVESLLLAVTGGALGVWMGYGCLEGLKYLAEGSLELWQPIALDARAVAAAAAMSLAASLLFGLAPAVQASRTDVHAGLVEAGTRSIVGGRRRWSRRALVVAQVGLGVVLLVSAGLLLRTFAHLRGLDPGFDAGNLVVASVSLEDARYRSNQDVSRLFDGTLERMRRVPGVEAAAVSLGVPYQRLLNLGFRQLDGGPGGRGAVTSAAYVAGEFLRAFGIPLRGGRAFDERDTAASPGVAIVNETFARTHYAGKDPVGRRIAFAGREREIVGMVGDVQVRPGWGDFGPLAAMPLAYIPVSQASDGMLRLVHGWFSPAFVIRTSLPVDRIVPGLRRALDDLDPLLPFAEVRRFSEVQAASLAPQRFLMAIVLALAAAALLLGAVGLHGLIATAVAERTREMGIRLALGATTGGVVWTLALPGIALSLAGVALGSAASLAAGRLVGHFVWGVSPRDPATFLAVAAVFLLVATAASLAPALRVLRLDPAQTLRAD